MAQIIRYDNTSEEEAFNVQLVNLAEPIMIKDESKTNEENKNVTVTSDKHIKDHLEKYNPGFDLIFPPREWEENGITWRQVASTKPASQDELLKLNESLASHISYWNIQSKGLTPIRKELYGQYFDELIRQVYIYNDEMGELLIKIRNEFKLTMEAYIYNFENGFMFSARKSKINVQEFNEIKMDVKTMEHKNLSLKKSLAKAYANLNIQQKELTDESNALIEKNKQELEFMVKNHEVLHGQLNTLLKLKK